LITLLALLIPFLFQSIKIFLQIIFYSFSSFFMNLN